MHAGSYIVRDMSLLQSKHYNATRWDLFTLISWVYSTNRAFIQRRKWSLAFIPMHLPKSLVCCQRLRQTTIMNLSTKRLYSVVILKLRTKKTLQKVDMLSFFFFI